MKSTSVISLLGLAVLSTQALAKVQLSQEVAFVPGEVLIKLRPGKKLPAHKFLDVKQEMNLLAGQFVLVSSPAKSMQALVSELQAMPEVAYAEPNLIYHAIKSHATVESILAGTISENFSASAPRDPLYGSLWGLNNSGSNEPGSSGAPSGSQGVIGADVGAEAAWDITRGSKNVRIAIIDTGIDYNHPDLKNQIWTNPKEIAGNGIDDDQNGYIDDIHGWNAVAANGNPMDGNAHGTHCAGTIGAEHNNGVGVAGVMADVQMLAVKFLGDDGSGSLANAVIAIDYATKQNVDIMSNSWGGGGFSQALEDSIKAASVKGILFVAAAGNDAANNDSSPHYPSNYNVENVISVAAHTNADQLASFSCYGKRTVHVAAPGHNILSSTPGSNYKVFSGTSMATPHVSGGLGLLIAKEGRLPTAEVRNRLMATSTPTSVYQRKVLGGGRMNLSNLLNDVRIPRQGPDESAWRVETLSDVFESAHPYANNAKTSKAYSFPGARYVRLVVEKHELETGYDFISLKDAKGVVIEKISGSGTNYESDYAETDSITVEFSSDNSETKWGFAIKEVKVIY